MLTKNKVKYLLAQMDCPLYLHNNVYVPIYEQCMKAIDLQAENEKLIKEIKFWQNIARTRKADIPQTYKIDSKYIDDLI